MKRLYITFLIFCIPSFLLASDCAQNCEAQQLTNDSTQLPDDPLRSRKELLARRMGEIMESKKRLDIVDLKPSRICPDPDISQFITDGAESMTLETLKNRFGKILLSTMVIEDALENGTWHNTVVRSEDGMSSVEIWVRKGKIWAKPLTYSEQQELAMSPGSVNVRSQWYCERPHLLDKFHIATPKQEL